MAGLVAYFIAGAALQLAIVQLLALGGQAMFGALAMGNAMLALLCALCLGNLMIAKSACRSVFSIGFEPAPHSLTVSRSLARPSSRSGLTSGAVFIFV